jgi:two-component system response regulator MprA
MAPRVLVVDDDVGVRQAVGRALSFEGYEVEQAADGEEALAAVDRVDPDAIVLDLVMPGTGGLEVCRSLRAAGNDVAVLVLTARHELSDRVAGLDAGADDYLVKPFALEELLARLRALVRRVTVQRGDASAVLTLADLSLDPDRYVVQRAGSTIELTRTEFNLLELLLRNAGQVLPRSLILERVWGYDFDTSSNSLDVYIGYLRRKTEADGGERLIHTVRGVGYVAREPA